MQRRLRQIIANEGGLEVVQWVAMGAVLLTLISTVYGVFNGSERLRSSISSALGWQGVNFGYDVTVRGPDVRHIPTQRVPFSPIAREVVPNLPRVFKPTDAVRMVFDPVTKAILLYLPTEHQRVVVTPAPTVKVTTDPVTQQVRLFDPQQKQLVLFDPNQRTIVAVDPVTFVKTPVDLVWLQQVGFVAVRWEAIDTAPVSFVATPTLSIPALLLPMGG